MPHRDDFEDFDKDTEMLVAQIGKFRQEENILGQSRFILRTQLHDLHFFQNCGHFQYKISSRSKMSIKTKNIVHYLDLTYIIIHR